MMMKKMDIIYEDKYLLVVNKPTKLLCIATSKEIENTLYHEASLYVKKKHKSNKIFIVHRLDKDTSGVVVFAKDEKTKKLLQDNWDKYAVNREYIALVKGHIKPEKNTLKNKLVETKTNMVYVDDKSKLGKHAVTKYEVINYKGNDSLIKINILTGRKNQIRVQLDYIGYPIIGDTKYGKNKSFYNRLMLHANKLELIHPVTSEKLELIARNPKEFNK
ncbi:MAG: RNA pseudouridine synthase [Bacilli bacterium]|nr:RNA pseudouridine synthase [Bacilli bacterium]